ncbi:MAG: hypothetical protein COB83_13130 [Gammaproteobacteria bacterium]|nr:MAG: hypothetical protein COB83_13130 [Gammaproteobacteria bacterium]
MGVKKSKIFLPLKISISESTKAVKLLISVYFSRFLVFNKKQQALTGSKLKFSGANITTKSPFYSTGINNFYLQFRP